jgi:hypothetical protein
VDWTRIVLSGLTKADSIFATSVSTSGYSPRGERFYTEERLGRAKLINALASMSAQGIFAVDFCHNGSIDYETFEEHILRAVASLQ